MQENHAPTVDYPPCYIITVPNVRRSTRGSPDLCVEGLQDMPDFSFRLLRKYMLMSDIAF